MHEKAPLLKARHRDEQGSRRCRRLRSKGELPAVVYGRGKEPVSIALESREAIAHITKGEKVFRLDFPGAKDKDEGQMVLLRDLQFDYLGTNIVHADFTRVSLSDRVKTRVPIHLIGEAKGLKTAGAILVHPASDIEVECPVVEIPEYLEVRIDDLDVDQMITAGEVKFPSANFKLLSDSHAAVAQIVVQAEIKTGEATTAGAAAAPEVTTAKKEEGAAGAAKGAAAPAAKGAAPAAKGAAPAAKPAAKK
jgi:large subunit ribosomal protein L25